jgi:hypothetical protein
MRDTATRDFVRSELRDLLEEMEERGLVVVNRAALDAAEAEQAADGTAERPT